MTLCTCAFSQESNKSLSLTDFLKSITDVMEMVISPDTVVVMKKPHAKYIAGIRVKYNYQLKYSVEQDSTITALQQKVGEYIKGESLLFRRITTKDTVIIALQTVNKGLERERDGFESLWKDQKKTTWLVGIIAVLTTILGFTL